MSFQSLPNEILLGLFEYFHLNFRSISKNGFSDDDETPQQTDLSLSQNLHFSQFIHLRLLSLYHIRTNLPWPILVDQWQQMITICLAKLEVFRLKMEFSMQGNREQALDELIHSFRSRFWLYERRWYIRCHWYPVDIS